MGAEQVGYPDHIVCHNFQRECRSNFRAGLNILLPGASGLFFDPTKYFFDPLSGIDRLGLEVLLGHAALNC
jgi:hypothetical protein